MLVTLLDIAQVLILLPDVFIEVVDQDLITFIANISLMN